MRLNLLAEDSVASTVLRWVNMIKDDPNVDDVITAFDVAKKSAPNDLYNQLSDAMPDIYDIVKSLSEEDKAHFRYYVSQIAPDESFKFKVARWGWLPGMRDRWTWTEPRALEDVIIKINDDVWPVGEYVINIAKCNTELLKMIEPELVREFIAKARDFAIKIRQNPQTGHTMANAVLTSIKDADDKWNGDYIRGVILDIMEEYPKGVFNGDLVNHVYKAIADDYHPELQRELPGIIQNIVGHLIRSQKLIKGQDGSINLAT